MTTRLPERDRRFFALVAEACFANPFGTERARIDGEIAEAKEDDPLVLARLSARLTKRIEELSGTRPLSADDYAGEDRELVRAALLFHFFHIFLADIDALIEVELTATEPRKVPFARNLLSTLAEHGVASAEAVRMLELFYQIRRAHSFIAQKLIGRGPSMRRVREDLWNAVFTRDIRRYERHLWNRMEDFSTLILGETGTGKGQAAAAVGRSGFIRFDERRGSFSQRLVDGLVPLHLSEFPETLIESELFGHRKGAFTGAIDQHVGALARVRPFGAIFLDEIGEVSLPVQVKLLRVLQERTFTPVGGHEAERFHGRVLAATHRSPSDLRERGLMRDDFYYRLCATTIEIPPLRVRLADDPRELPELVAHLCARVVGEPSAALASEVCERIQSDLGAHYEFAGNVRELEQCVRRVLLTGSCASTTKAQRTDASGLAQAIERGQLTAEEVIRQYCRMLYARTPNFVEVAGITGLDRRTVKKYVEA